MSVPDEKWDVTDLSDNDAMFWAVMGGNPCSFGIITEIELRCIRDADHPNSTGVKINYTLPANRGLLKPMMTAFGTIQELAKAGKVPPDYDFFFTMGDLGASFMKITFQGIYSNVKGKDEEYDPQWFKIITDADKYHPLEFSTQPIKDTEHHPLSEMMTKAVILTRAREFNLPYKVPDFQLRV